MEQLLVDLDGFDPLAGLPDPRPQFALCVAKLATKAVWIGVEAFATVGDFDPVVGIVDRREIDHDVEPVQELRTEPSLLGVHRADQHEVRRVADGDALALDDVLAHRRGV